MTTRILLAEDNERLASMLKGFLESLGHQVLTAADGISALHILQGGGVDLLVLDLKLPGMNGVDLLKTVRRTPELRKVEVVIMTGVYRGDQYARAAEKLGVRAYLEKPFSKEAFLQAVSPPEKSTAQPTVDLLIEAYKGRLSGTVQFAGGDEVTILKGETISFSSKEFIPFLLASGHLSRTDLDSYPPQEGGRLRLSEAGLLSYDELLEQSRLFLSKKLTDAVQQNLAATFHPDKITPELPLTPVSLPRQLHLAARSAAAAFEVDSYLARFGEAFPSMTADYFRFTNLLSMSREEIELLDRLAGRPTVAELVTVSPDRGRSASFLDFLVRMGMIALHGSPQVQARPEFPQKRLFNRPIEEVTEGDAAVMTFDDLVDEVSDSVELVVGEEGMAAPLSANEITFEQDVQRDYAAIQDKNYYEIFSMTQATFSFAGLKEAYFAKTREYSPERFMELSGATLARAQDVLSHYANAYNTLSNVIAKERYDEMLKANSLGTGREEDQLQARIQFQSGKVFLEMEDFSNAERALQEAYTLDPQDAQTSAYLAWSIYKNPSNRGSNAAQEKSRMLLSKSLQMGRCAEAFAFRGWILLDEGRDGLAEGEFQKALKVNARERTALAGLRIIADRREAEKKGLFKRIFG